MTMIFTSISVYHDLITMTVDSSVTNTSTKSGWTEYVTGRKIYCYDGVGCVATWGTRDYNIGRYLEKQNLSPNTHSIDDLADLVETYLTQEYKPDAYGHDDVGYHVAGFDRGGKPKFFHRFWGVERPTQKGEKQDYHIHPATSHPVLVYNGRDELADIVVNSLLNEVRAGKTTNYDLRQQVSLVSFGDFVARFAGEITPEVGPPFLTTLISLRNVTRQVINRSFNPLIVDLIVQNLVTLGYVIEGVVITPHEIVVRGLPDLVRELVANSTLGISSGEVLIASSSVIEGSPKLHLNADVAVYPDFLLCLPGGRCSLEDDGSWHGVPDLIIEVLSPETERTDRGQKFELYQNNKVKEYWLINPIEHFMEVWCFDEQQPLRRGIFGIGDEGFDSCSLSCTVSQETLEAIVGNPV